MKTNDLAKNPTYVQKNVTIVEGRFLDLCRAIGFGQVHVDVAHGQPVEILEGLRKFRLDLQEPPTRKEIGPDAT